MEDVAVHGRIILKCVFVKIYWEGVNWINLIQ